MMKLKTKNKQRKINTLLYLAAVGLSIVVFGFVVGATWIGYEIKTECQQAQRQYDGDCVQALSAVLADEDNSFRQRNSAVWALGQIGDPRPLELLQSYYTGNIPAKGSLDEALSQYELKKAIDQVSGGMNILRWIWAGGFVPQVEYNPATHSESVLVARPDDTYYPLAEEIAAMEDIPMVASFSQAIELQPHYIILVAEPANLTQERLVNIGRIFKKLDAYPALGFISGGNLAEARALWQRSKETQDGPAFLGTDIEKGQLVWQPTLFDLSSGQADDLNQDNLIKALSQARYFYWARHVSSNKWFWNTNADEFGDDDKLLSEEVPQMPASLIFTPSCGSFQPWKEDSIALAFVDRGAAAYAGHMHSPVSNGFIMQHTQTVPGRHTWPGFPFGILNQIENRVGARVDFATPMAFMLGDPRLFQDTEAPYQITSDNTGADGKRVIRGTSDIAGILPVVIEGGAAYAFVELDGVDAISEIDLFYNKNLHSLDLGGDKYLLMIHGGGDFELRLQSDVPLTWWALDSLRDALDYSCVALGISYGPFSLLCILAFALIVYFQVRRKGLRLSTYRTTLIIATLLAAVKLVYLLLRLDNYSVYASVAVYSPWQIALGFLGNFASTAAGLILMLSAQKTIGRITGALVATLPQLVLSLTYLVYISYINLAFLSGNTVSMPLFNYSAFWLPFLVLLLEIAIYFATYNVIAHNNEEK